MSILAIILGVGSTIFANVWNSILQNIFIFFSFFLFSYFLIISFKNKKIILPKNSIYIFFVFLLTSFSLVISPIKNIILPEYLNFISGLLFLFPIILLKDELKKRKNLVYFLFSLIIIVFIYQFISNQESVSTLKNSNTLAFISLLAIGFCLDNKNIYMSLFLFAIIFATRSAGAVLGVFLASLLYVYDKKAFKEFKKNIFLTISIIFLLIIVLIFLDSNSLKDRILWWNGALSMFLQRPLFGFGIGAFPYVYPLLNNLSNSLSSVYVHNYYLEFLSENGIISSILWFYFLFYSFLKISGYSRYFVFAALVHSLFDFGLSTAYGFYFFIFILGLNIKTKEYEINIKYKKLFFLLFLILFVSILKFLDFSYKSIYIEKQINQSLKMIEKKEYDQAFEKIKLNLNKYPLNYPLNRFYTEFLLRDAYIKNQKNLFFIASYNLEKLLILNPYDKWAYLNLEKIYTIFQEEELLKEITERKSKCIKWIK